MADKKVLVILADGFEEVEALGPIDVLRRCGAEVTIAGLDAMQIRGAHNVIIGCNALLSDVCSNNYDAVVLPGGLPGAQNLHDSKTVSEVLLKANAEGALVCAICASPAFVLGPLGLLDGKKATCYPGADGMSPQLSFLRDRTVKDGNVITGKGPGAALEFGLEIAQALYGEQVRNQIHADMICQGN